MKPALVVLADWVVDTVDVVVDQADGVADGAVAAGAIQFLHAKPLLLRAAGGHQQRAGELRGRAGFATGRGSGRVCRFKGRREGGGEVEGLQI